MRRSLAILVLVAIIGVAGIYFFILPSNSTQEEGGNKILSECKNKTGNDRHLCFIKKISKLDKYEKCEEIKNQETRVYCYGFMSGKKGNESICNFVSKEEKGTCFKVGAINWNRLSFCEKIKDFDSRTYCYGYIAGKIENSTICENLNNKEADSCFHIAAINHDLPKFCDKIKDNSTREFCRSQTGG